MSIRTLIMSVCAAISASVISAFRAADERQRQRRFSGLLPTELTAGLRLRAGIFEHKLCVPVKSDFLAWRVPCRETSATPQ